MKVEYGIALPLERKGYKKYPFEDMAVGSSFYSPPQPDNAHRVYNAARQFVLRHRPRWSFTVRSFETGAVRCWRIK